MEADLQARLEIRDAVAAMIQNLQPLAQGKPEATTRGDDFNRVLERARSVFSASGAIQDLPKIEGVATLVDLLGKLSILGGAINADFSARSYAAAERHNKRVERQWREFNR